MGADFAGCDGVTMLIWRGHNDVHGTVQAEAAEGFTLLGTSVQIATYLVKKVTLYLTRCTDLSNKHVVADMNYQLGKMV